MTNFEVNGIIINGDRYDITDGRCANCDIKNICYARLLGDLCLNLIGTGKIFKKSNKQFEL